MNKKIFLGIMMSATVPTLVWSLPHWGKTVAAGLLIATKATAHNSDLVWNRYTVVGLTTDEPVAPIIELSVTQPSSKKCLLTADHNHCRQPYAHNPDIRFPDDYNFNYPAVSSNIEISPVCTVTVLQKGLGMSLGISCPDSSYTLWPVLTFYSRGDSETKNCQ